MKRGSLRLGMDSQTLTRRSDWGRGKGRSSTASMTLKMALVAPMPKPAARIAHTDSARFRRKSRIAKRRFGNAMGNLCGGGHLLDDVAQERLGIAEQHQGFVQIAEVVIDAC